MEFSAFLKGYLLNFCWFAVSTVSKVNRACLTLPAANRSVGWLFVDAAEAYRLRRPDLSLGEGGEFAVGKNRYTI